MQIHFTLNYQTVVGQQIFIVGNIPELGANNLAHALPLGYKNAQQWDVVVALPNKYNKGKVVTYNYFVVAAAGTKHFEGGTPKSIALHNPSNSNLQVNDAWTDPSWAHTIFETAPFKNAFLKPHADGKQPKVQPGELFFQVAWPHLEQHQSICILGSAPALGKWNVGRPLQLQPLGNGKYGVACTFAATDFPLNYKYGLYNNQQNAFLGFESGIDRTIYKAPSATAVHFYNDSFLRLPAPLWKAAGVAVPVFSLRTKQSLGVGEFLDLMPLVDWAANTGLKVVQILPVNDTTASHTNADSYPYAAISAFALHPIYINLMEVAQHLGLRMSADWLQTLKTQTAKLNQLPTLAYAEVHQTKRSLLGQLFEEGGAITMADKAFKQFFKEHKPWLEAYAAFCFFRDLHGTAQFASWPNHQSYSSAALKKLAKTDAAFQLALENTYFTQYHLHRQLQAAHQYAIEKGVVFKGDVPIGIYRHSADAWQQPALYHMHSQAGAPPDDFAVKGQNWGFPTYNWPQMAADGFLWWQQRFAQMRNYYDAFRIDHILGFFRIWSIPMHAVDGIMGYFEPAIPVTTAEFILQGIPDDAPRYTQPYTDFLLLKKLFGDAAAHVATTFFGAPENGLYPLKPEFATQQQVAAYFGKLEKQANNQELQSGLMEVISNVLLFEVPSEGGPVYHFRFHMERTHSFKALPVWQQTRLRSLYNNYFFERQDELWRKEALQKLPALKFATDMLVCGEDLGLVPACVPDVMQRTGLLSLEVQRMPKNTHVPFLDLKTIPYLSVATPASHDTSTIRGWWEAPETDRETYYRDYLNQLDTPPVTATGTLVKQVIEAHLQAPAMLAIFQLQDWLGIDEALRFENVAGERINVPADPNHFWRYRFHLNLEDLNNQTGFNNIVRGMVQLSGRF